MASIIFIVIKTIYFPEFYGSKADLMPTAFAKYPYVLVPGFLMPSAVSMHVLSIVKLKKLKKTVTIKNTCATQYFEKAFIEHSKGERTYQALVAILHNPFFEFIHCHLLIIIYLVSILRTSLFSANLRYTVHYYETILLVKFSKTMARSFLFGRNEIRHSQSPATRL